VGDGAGDQPDEYDRNKRKKIGVVGLGIWPDGIDEHEIKQRWQKMLPREALNSGVTITLRAMVPIKKGRNDHALCSVPLSRKAGVCQVPQITPIMRAAQIGAGGGAVPTHASQLLSGGDFSSHSHIFYSSMVRVWRLF
jgi:hypothetical protein